MASFTKEIKGLKLHCEIYLFDENNQFKSQHYNFGYVQMVINDSIRISSIKIMRNTENNEVWLGMPSQLSKDKDGNDKHNNILNIDVEIKKMIINQINNILALQTKEEDKVEVPWELDL